MMENFFGDVDRKFEQLVMAPLPFLEGDSALSEEFIGLCKDIYDFGKTLKELSLHSPDPLPKLIIENFDNEQIWQEIEMLNKPNISHSLNKIVGLVEKKRRIRFKRQKIFPDAKECEQGSSSEEIDENREQLDRDIAGSSSEEEGFHFEESDVEDRAGDDSEHEEKESTERTEVDDDFFCLRKMEKFLEEQDKRYETGQLDNDEDEIDYFDDAVSDGDEIEIEDDEEDRVKSARHLKYGDYFDAPKNTEKDAKQTSGDTHALDASKPSQNVSTFKKQQDVISKKIKAMEEKMLDPADWQMKGEVKSTHRPENSLLQETLAFDHVARPPVEITEEHTRDLESLIKQRILDCAWDDIERRVKPADPAEYKKRILLDSSQSKLTLSEIYEKEYLEKQQKGGKDDLEEKESEAHAEIKKEMNDLFRKLDALSNFHFIATPPEPEIKVTSSMPSITMEEVQPVTHSETTTLAPEEIFNKSAAGEEKSGTEKSATDRKRERRKKKLQMKARAKERLAKMQKMDPNSDAVKKIEALKQLKNAAKVPRSNTVVLKANMESSEKLTSSQKFFSRLQDQSGIKSSKKKSRK